MNIFWLDEDIEKAAIAHCDKHVVKMVLESAQLLSSVVHKINNDHGPVFDLGRVYKATHMNHPCAKWVQASGANYSQLLKLLKFLLIEYTYRYNNIHQCVEIYSYLADFEKTIVAILPDEPTPKPLAMPDEFKSESVVNSYRNYYNYKYTQITMKWTRRSAPNWLIMGD